MSGGGETLNGAEAEASTGAGRGGLRVRVGIVALAVFGVLGLVVAALVE